jgi:hypothetical protein
VEITEYEGEEQHAYHFTWSKRDCCESCGYETSYSGTADIHEGQPNRNLDDFSMSEGYDSAEKGLFYEPEIKLSKNRIQADLLCLSESDDLISAKGRELLALNLQKVFDENIALLDLELLSKNIIGRCNVLQCNVCSSFSEWQISRSFNSGLALECPKCRVQQILDIKTDENKVHFFIDAELDFFSLEGERRENYKNPPPDLECKKCGYSDIEIFDIIDNNTCEDLADLREQEVTSVKQKITQCKNCNYYERSDVSKVIE